MSVTSVKNPTTVAAGASSAAVANSTKTTKVEKVAQNYLQKDQPQAKSNAAEAKFKIYNFLIAVDLNKHNTDIRQRLLDEHSSSHISHTRKLILKEADHLNKEESVVVVFGAQYFGPKQEPVEPLATLLGKCKKLILVDYDEATLKVLKTTLNDPKVETRQIDLTGGLHSSILRLASVWEKTHPKERFLQDYNSIISDALTAIIGSICFNAEKILGAGNKANYVISSLVGVDLHAGFVRTVNFVTQQFFKQNLGALVEQYPILRNEIFETESLLQNVMHSRHIDLACSLVGGKGKVYLADTTVVIKHEKRNLNGQNFYQNILPKIKKMDCKKKDHTWVWNSSENKFQINAWVFTNVKKTTSTLDLALKKACLLLTMDELKQLELSHKGSQPAASPSTTSPATNATQPTQTPPSTPPVGATTSLPASITNLEGVD